MSPFALTFVSVTAGTSDPVDMSKLLETPGDVRTFPFKVQDAKKKITGSIVIMAVLTLP